MKKGTILLLAILCLANIRAFAQRKIEYGFRIGGGIATQRVNNNSVLSVNAIRTFNVNGVVSFPVLKQYYLRTSLGITNKGSEVTENGLTTTNKILYYELPVNFMRKYDVPTLGKIIVGIGGYIAMGDRGTITFETPGSINSDYISFGDDNDFKQFDEGLSLISGLELNNHLTFNLGYDVGLKNIASLTAKDTGTKSVYNREFTITLGLTF